MRLTAIGLSLAGALLVAVPGHAKEPCPDPLIQGWEPWPPYQIAREGEPTGVDIEIVKAIADEMGCSVGHARMPWSRLLSKIESGEVDFAVQANYTEERAKFAYYSEPYMPYETRLIVEDRGKTDYESLKAFLAAGNTVGIVRNYDYGDETAALLGRERYREQVIEAYKVADHVRPLVGDRIDGVIAEPFVFTHEARQQGIRDAIAITDVTVTSVQTYAIFSKESTSKSTVDAFNDAMAAVKADGTFAAIRERYLD